MNIVFVNSLNFLSNGAIQMFHLANELVARGHECLCVVPSGKDSVRGCGEPRFRVAEFSEVRSQRLGFRDGRGPDLIHAWPPREGVRKLVLELSTRHGCPYFVHFEDNEDYVTAKLTGLPLDGLLTQPDAVLDPRVGDEWAHPRRFREFVAGACGVTALIDRLLEFVPDHIPSQVFWPGYSERLFRPQPADSSLKRALGIADDRFVVTYNGNAHSANAGEMRSLYLAVALLNRVGRPVTLLRLGVDAMDFLGDVRRWVEPHVVALGGRPHAEQPRYLALADALVQPGRSDAFNDYRFPSKLPEFLAMARAVVLPNTNIGRYLTDGENCLLLREGHAREIAEKLECLVVDPELRRRLAEAGHRFGAENLRWAKAAEAVGGLYARAIPARRTARAAVPADGQLAGLAARYAHFRPAALGYATVEDFCDSLEHLPQLAAINNDLKDAQRPWVCKAICGNVRPGGRLLEIGGGDPWVAELLTKLGYQVTIVDPYDGRDQGPTAFDRIRDQHPHVRFVRGLFPDALPADEPPFDCIYSVSVLEHLSPEQIARVCDGIERLTTASDAAVTIHAVDHVHRGRGAEQHLTNLQLMIEALGLAREELASLLERLDADPETYFLSAESHNMWRGATPYRDFPMRRCASIQVCAPVRRATRAAASANGGSPAPRGVDAALAAPGESR